MRIWSLLATLILCAAPAGLARNASASPALPSQAAGGRTPATIAQSPVPAGSPVAINADLITYDAARQVVVAQGSVRIVVREFEITADAASYDLRAQVVTVTGRVNVLDPRRRRQLRGSKLTYNVRTEEGLMESMDGIVDPERRVYVRGARLEFTPTRLIAHDSMVTTCDPSRPLLSTTARHVVIHPNQELIATDAAVHLGGRRLYSTPRLRVSLRPDDGTLPVPGFGSNAVDGFWLDRRVRVTAPQTSGDVYLKYGFRSGLFAYLTLTREMPAYSATLRLGRTQTYDSRQAFDLLPYDVAELALASRPVPLGSTPFSLQFGAAAGWFGERNTGLSTTRLDGRVTLKSARMPVAPRLSSGAQVEYRVSQYGTGATRTVASFGADLTYEVDPHTWVTLAYSHVNIRGPQPLLIDNVEPASTVSVSVARVIPDRYRVTLGTAHNAALAETTYFASAAVVVRRNYEFAVSAIYNTRLSAFEDIDYSIRAICDCLDVVVRYRQMRREFSFEIGFIGSGVDRALLPRSPRPAPTLPPDPPPERSH